MQTPKKKSVEVIKKTRQNVTTSPATTTPSKTQRLVWTSDHIEKMLEMRFSELAHKKFNACKTTKQKNEWWTWLAARLSIKIGRCVESKQLQNRYTLLKAEYRSLISAEKETGNANDSIQYPEYWETLVDYFQVIFMLTVICRNSPSCIAIIRAPGWRLT